MIITSRETQPENNTQPRVNLMAKPFRESRKNQNREDGGSTSHNALAFSTLLSSQVTDAHHRETCISHPGLCFDVFTLLHFRTFAVIAAVRGTDW
jgi:hypothetical protein